MFGGLGIPVERSLRWFSPKLQVAAEKLGEPGRSSPRALKRNTFSMTYGAAEQIAEKPGFRRTAPKGASQFKELTASLKRCPDTKLGFSAICEAAPLQSKVKT